MRKITWRDITNNWQQIPDNKEEFLINQLTLKKKCKNTDAKRANTANVGNEAKRKGNYIADLSLTVHSGVKWSRSKQLTLPRGEA